MTVETRNRERPEANAGETESAAAQDARGFTSVEALIDRAARFALSRLPQDGPAAWGVEFVSFGLKQGWASLFGGIMVVLMVSTSWFWPENAPLQRYDFLFLAALAAQFALIAFRLETLREAKVILIFHIAGTAMELFKTAAGSWAYPEAALFRIEGVPLFSGFMYAAVGSYMARVTRVFDIRLSAYPPLWASYLLAAAIYINFFAHHFVWDMRYALFAAIAVIFWRSGLHFRVYRRWRRMPLLLGFLLVTFFIWLAENLGTLSRTWLYPSQAAGWVPVGPEKLGSWFLLMIVSVVLVTLVHPPRQPDLTHAEAP